MLKRLELLNVGPAPELSMELASRLNLITGDNGLGKSFLLDVAWWALTRRWPHELNHRLTAGYPARPRDVTKPASISFEVESKVSFVEFKSTYMPREESWLGRAGRPWNPGLVLYAHADGGFSVWDPARNYWRKKGRIDVQERQPGYAFSARDVLDGLDVEVDGRSTVLCNGLLRDWSTWIRENGSMAKSMSELLQTLAPSGEELAVGPLTRLSVDDARDIPSIRTKYSDAVPILHASSGVRRVVGLAYMLLWSWSEHVTAAKHLGEERTSQVVLLFDEIESHLHPRWQRSILNPLLSIMRSFDSKATVQLIATTHSPLVLASAEPIFDAAKDAWFDLDLEVTKTGPRVELRRRPFVRHGDVSNWLTSEAFDLKSGRSLEAEAAIEKARALLRSEAKPNLKTALTVDGELRKAGLPDIDPFWVRWSKFIENLKQRV